MSSADVQKLNQLVPDLARRVAWLLQVAARYGADVAVVSGLRSQAEQDRLYAQGRTTPGPIVTWTRSSAHVTGRAVDLAFRVGGVVDYDVPAWWWDALAYLASFAGLRRTAVSKGDLGHFEL